MPVSAPVVRVMVPTAGLLLCHVPPVVVLLIVTVVAGHIDVGPVMAAGKGLTVMGSVREQPVAVNVYDTVAVPPGAPPVTTPPADIGAMVLLLLLHVPPGDASVNAEVRPTHTVGVPPMVAGCGFTVTTTVL